jgi:outer membrane protein OmpA-like peptidoglycan-associated protein
MKTLLVSLLFAAAATPAAAGPDFVTDDRPNKKLAASEGTQPQTPLDDVVFEHDSSVLISSALQQIETVAHWMLAHPGHRVVLEGHANSLGAAVHNEDLALRRADMVRMHLVDHGVPSDRILIVGYGETGAQKRPNPIDRRVVIYASKEPLAKLVAASMDKGAVTTMWTHNEVLFTERRGAKNVNARSPVATRK